MSRGGPSLVRLSLVHGDRRRDLAVPAGVPVAALLSALADEVLEPPVVRPAGWDLCTLTGRCLSPESGLAEQGVRDGALLVLTARGEPAPPHPHDDLVEAVREVVARDRRTLPAPAAWSVVLAGAAALVGLTIAALLTLEDGALAATAGASALVVATVLLVAAHGSRGPAPGGQEVPALVGTAAPLACGAAATGVAAAGGLLLAPAGHACLAGGTALAVASAVGLGLLARTAGARALLVPPVVTGGVLAATGAASLLGPGAAARVLPTALVLAAVVAGAAPRWALPAVGRGPAPLLLAGQAGPAADRAAPGSGSGSVDHHVRGAHELVLASVAVVGVLLVVTAPVAVEHGAGAAVLVVAAAALTALRSRRHHGAALVLTGLVGGAGGLVSTTVAVLLLVPSARPAVAGGLLVCTIVLAASVPVLRTRSGRPVTTTAASTVSAAAVRARRAAGALETAALVSLLPLLTLSSGLLDLARGV